MSFYTRSYSSTWEDKFTLSLVTFSFCFSFTSRVRALSELLFSMSRKADFDIDSTTKGNKIQETSISMKPWPCKELTRAGKTCRVKYELAMNNFPYCVALSSTTAPLHKSLIPIFRQCETRTANGFLFLFKLKDFLWEINPSKHSTSSHTGNPSVILPVCHYFMLLRNARTCKNRGLSKSYLQAQLMRAPGEGAQNGKCGNAQRLSFLGVGITDFGINYTVRWSEWNLNIYTDQGPL